jgi:uncharacterized protein YbjT (DUF2867 family)
MAAALNKTHTILVTGATGNVTSHVIEALKGRGHRLIALVRDPTKAASLLDSGIELRKGDLDRPRSLEGDVFAGVDVAWVLVPPGPLAPFQSSNAVWAARCAGVKHIVRMSAVGAAFDAPSLNGRMHALSDSELSNSGISFTIVKPHFFTQNLMFSAASVADHGGFYLPLGDAKLPMIDSRDIGLVVAEILANPAAHSGKTYTLTGPRQVSMEEFTKELSKELGKPVKYVSPPVDKAIEQMASHGADDFSQTMMRDYFTAYSRGWQDTVTSSVKDITGREPRGITDFVRDYAQGFGKK